jgi:pilus assembly protein CpaF
MKLRIVDRRSGEERIVDVARLPATFGRTADNAIPLPDEDVSRHHARLAGDDGRLAVADLGSTNQTLLNGTPLAPNEPAPFAAGDSLRIGPFTIALVPEGTPAREPEAAPVHEGESPDDAMLVFKRLTHERFLERTKKLRRSTEGMDEGEFRRRVEEAIVEMLEEATVAAPKGWTRDALVQELVNDFLGLGPLEEFLADDSVSEIMVNGPNQVYVERKGKLTLTSKRFIDDGHVLNIIQRIIQPLGRRIDESVPYVDARLQDGSRVHAIIPPLALNGPTLTIRKFSRKKLTAEDLVGFGAMSPQLARFLELIVKYRANVLVSGGTGSGKTTLLNVLSNFIPDGDRIITVEDSAELKLSKRHVVSLESRPKNVEGKGEVSIRELVRNTLRMRPDRIVVGECRGGEALDMLQAMNTGHDGSLTTIHANSPRDTLARLETLVLMAGMELPSKSIREQIAAAINFVVQTARLGDGSRKVTSVTEVTGLEANATFTTAEVFVFKQEGFDEKGRVIGRFKPTGNIPMFVERLRPRGVSIDMEVFSDT